MTGEPEQVISTEIFLGTATGVVEEHDRMDFTVVVELATIEGKGDELRIRPKVAHPDVDAPLMIAMIEARYRVHPDPFVPALDPEKLRRLIYVWDIWSDNAHRPGCEHQTRLDWRTSDDDSGVGRFKTGAPCPFCGHAFNTEPMYEPLPYDVVEFVELELLGTVPRDQIKVTTLDGEARRLRPHRPITLLDARRFGWRKGDVEIIEGGRGSDE